VDELIDEVRAPTVRALLACSAAAFAASAAATSIAHPLDSLKSRKQMVAEPPTARPDARAPGRIASIPGASGTHNELFPPGLGAAGRVQLLYHGLGENVLQEALTTGVFLGLYEFLKPRIMAPGTPLEAAPLLGYLIAVCASDPDSPSPPRPAPPRPRAARSAAPGAGAGLGGGLRRHDHLRSGAPALLQPRAAAWERGGGGLEVEVRFVVSPSSLKT